MIKLYRMLRFIIIYHDRQSMAMNQFGWDGLTASGVLRIHLPLETSASLSEMNVDDMNPSPNLFFDRLNQLHSEYAKLAGHVQRILEISGEEL